MSIFGLRDKALSFSICLIAVVVGCRDGRERSDIKSNVAMPHHEQVTSQKEENDDSRNAIEKFKTRVQQLAGMLDARGCDSYSLAYDLCKEATADSQTNLYEILSGIYVKAATNISFDIEHDAQGEEKEHNRLEVRLRNQWNISQWAALTIFFRNPEKIEGWNILLDVILKERKAATAADSAMPALNLNDRRQSTQYRRLEHFKKEMGLEEDSQLRRINHIYHSISHRLTLEQRAAIVSHVKSVLGKLPSEMEKDLPQTKKERH